MPYLDLPAGKAIGSKEFSEEKGLQQGMYCAEIGASESVADALARVITEAESEGQGVSMQLLAIRDILMDMEARGGVLSAFVDGLKGEAAISAEPDEVHSM